MGEIWSSVLEAALALTMLEILATVFGVTQVILSSKLSVWTYPAGIISVILSYFYLLQIGLYAEAWLNVFYFVMSIYGWYKWVDLKKKKMQGTLIAGNREITTCSAREHLLYALISIVTWMLIYYVLDQYTKSTVPLADSFTTALFFVGMILMALKKIENWIYLIVGDILCIPLLWYKQSYLFAFQFLLFTVIAIWGYMEWRKQLGKNSRFGDLSS